MADERAEHVEVGVATRRRQSEWLTPDLDELGQAMASLQRLRSSRRIAASLAAAAGVTLSAQEIAVLSALGDDTLPVAKLARAAAMDVGAVSRQVRSLEASGHVVKRSSAGNGSVVLVEATAAGRNAVRRVDQIRSGHLIRALAQWDPDERRQLARQLDRLVRDLVATPYVSDAESTRPSG